MPRKITTLYARGVAPPEPVWRFGLGLTVPRGEVPAFVQSLSYLVDSLDNAGGGTYLFPDHANERTGTAIEWYLSKGRTRFWYRLGLEFQIDSNDLTAISAYVSYGASHPDYDKEVNLSEDQRTVVQQAAV